MLEICLFERRRSFDTRSSDEHLSHTCIANDNNSKSSYELSRHPCLSDVATCLKVAYSGSAAQMAESSVWTRGVKSGTRGYVSGPTIDVIRKVERLKLRFGNFEYLEFTSGESSHFARIGDNPWDAPPNSYGSRNTVAFTACFIPKIEFWERGE
jgi:hypothetical protein